MPETYTLREAAERVAVSPPVARLRERGHGLEQIRRATRKAP